MYFTPSEEIKSRLDIVDVIQGYIKLQKAGANYRALCPFHKEKTPSFFVSPSRQIWHCFGGCSDGGDIFKFVMRMEGVEFGDALRILADKAGLKLKKQDPKLASQRSKLQEICEEAAQFFQENLRKTEAGKQVINYLKGRNISEASIKEFRIGYVPDEWRGLLKHLAELGYDLSDIEKAGLIIKKEKSPQTTNHKPQTSDYYDRFRSRIMFPITDFNGQVVGFTGRVFGSLNDEMAKQKGIAKYVNSPQTMIYDKSRIIYGLDKAKIDIRKNDKCILVEGNTDLILSHQVGVKNVIATSGTALTPYQLKIIKRYTQNLVFCFDMDLAGDSATRRGIDLAQLEGFNIGILNLPEGKDPADFIKEKPDAWPKLIEKSNSVYEFYFESTFSKFDPTTAEGKKEIAKIILPVLKNIPNKIEQSHWVQELAKRLNTKEEYVFEEMKKIGGAKKSYFDLGEEGWGQKQAVPKKSRKESLEERALMILLNRPEILNSLKSDLNFLSQRGGSVIEYIKRGKKLDSKPIVELTDYLNYLGLYADFEKDKNLDYEAEVALCMGELQNLYIKEKLNELSLEIQKREREGDEAGLKNLIEEFNNLSKKLVEQGSSQRA